MPEGPECHHICDILQEKLVGNELIGVDILSGRYMRHGDPVGWSLLKDKKFKIEVIGVKGKFLWWKLLNNNEDYYLFNTLGMSGQWTTERDKHSHIQFTLANEIIYFRDIRNFGTLKVVKGKKEWEKKLNSFGYDILGERIDDETIIKLFRSRDKWGLPKFLMNQGYLSGIGNYIKCEALHHCLLNPYLTIEMLSNDQILSLYQSIRKIAQESYQAKGASFQTYQDPDSNKGKYSFNFQVYGKKQFRNYTVIVERTCDGRSTHWCPEYLSINL